MAGLVCELIVMPSGHAFGWYHEKIFILIGMMFFSVSILFSMDIKKDWAVFLCLGAYGIACYHFQSSALILRIILILLAGRKEDPVKTAKIFFFGTAVIMLYAGIMSALGLHNTLYLTQVFRHEEETRWCFGFFHPNGFSLFLVKEYLLAIYIFGKTKNRILLITMTALCPILLILARSKMGIVCFVVTAALTFTALIIKKIDKPLFILGTVSMAFQTVFIYLLGVIPLPEIHNGEVENFWDFLNEITTGRLDHARSAFLYNKLTLFGVGHAEDVTEMGSVNMLFNQGILFAALYLAALFTIYYRMYKKHETFSMILILGSTFYSLSESFNAYFNKNPIFICFIGITLFPFLLKDLFGKKETDNK